MYMRKLILLFVIFWVIAGHSQTPPAFGTHTSITSTWTLPTSWIGCVATGLNGCSLQGVTETLTPPAGVPGGDVVVQLNAVTGYTYAPGGPLYCGTWNVAVVANWLDAAGKAAPSAPVQKSLVEPCPLGPSPAPSALSVSAK